jgi:hypothetical protein
VIPEDRVVTAPTRATMVQSVYEEIVVRGEEFVSVRLTPEATPTASHSPFPTRLRFPPFRLGTAPENVGIGAPDSV